MSGKGCIPWNKGKKGLQVAWNKGTKGICKSWNKGLILGKNPEHSQRMKGCTPWNKGKICPQFQGKNNGNWKHGNYLTKEYRKMLRHRRRYTGCSLNVKTIQQVYEDNIKQYGTLTCYLCLNPIEFGQDHLEHKTPLSRGGTNERDNLDIACQKCNRKKNIKTEQEFRKEQ